MERLKRTTTKEKIMELTPDEQFILNRYRYGTKTDRKAIYELTLKIDEQTSSDEKRERFNNKQNIENQ